MSLHWRFDEARWEVTVSTAHWSVRVTFLMSWGAGFTVRPKPMLYRDVERRVGYAAVYWGRLAVSARGAYPRVTP